VDESDDACEGQSVDDDSDGGSGTNEPQQVEGERRSSTPVSVARRNLHAQDNEEFQILKLLQTSASGDIVAGKPRYRGGREEVEAGRGKNREGERNREKTD
jgi:hypothetical protein